MDQVPSINKSGQNTLNAATKTQAGISQNSQIKKTPIPPKPPLGWSAHEYHHFEKTTDWYWIVAAVTIAAVALAIYFANYLFAVVLIVGIVSLLFHSSREPEFAHFELNDQGVKVHGSFYLYNTLQSFNVEEYHDDHKNRTHANLIIKSKKFLMPLIIIPIDQVQPEEVRRYIDRHLKHEDLHEPLSHRITDYLGF